MQDVKGGADFINSPTWREWIQSSDKEVLHIILCLFKWGRSNACTFLLLYFYLFGFSFYSLIRASALIRFYLYAHARCVWPHKESPSRQSVRISISFNITRPNMFPEVLPYWHKSFHKAELEGTGADSWDPPPGSLHGLFVQQKSVILSQQACHKWNHLNVQSCI